MPYDSPRTFTVVIQGRPDTFESRLSDLDVLEALARSPRPFAARLAGIARGRLSNLSATQRAWGHKLAGEQRDREARAARPASPPASAPRATVNAPGECFRATVRLLVTDFIDRFLAAFTGVEAVGTIEHQPGGRADVLIGVYDAGWNHDRPRVRFADDQRLTLPMRRRLRARVP